MSKQPRLEDLQRSLSQGSALNPAPLAQDGSAAAGRRQQPTPLASWNPPLSGVMDLRIARDGRWIHEGSEIRRRRLVQLFASILRYEDDDHYYLVTPVEKWRIEVADAPFVAVLLEVDEQDRLQQRLRFETNIGDRVTAGPDHPIVVQYAVDDGEPAPYLTVRSGLRALISRAVFVQLAEIAVEGSTTDGKTGYGVWSQRTFFWLSPLA